MLTKFRNFLAPPVFEDADVNFTARNLNVVLLSAVAGILLTIIRYIALGRIWSGNTGQILLSGALSVGLCYVLLRQGRILAGSLLAVAVLTLMPLLMMVEGDGIHDIAIMLLPVVVIVASMLFGWRGLSAYILIVALAFGTLVRLEIRGFLLTPSRHPVTNSDFTDALTILVVAGLMSGLLATSLRRNQQRLSETLREKESSEERYRLISGLTTDYVFSSSVHKDGRISNDWESGAFEAISEYSSEEFRAQGDWRAIVHPEDLSIDDQILEKLKKNQQASGEVRILTKSGKIRWIRVYARPIWDEQENRLIGIYGADQDITERKHAEESLRKSEALYRAAIVAAGAVPYYRDYRTNSYTFMGEGIAQMTGYTAAEMTPALWDSLEQESVLRGSMARLTYEEADRLTEAGVIRQWECDYRIRTRTGQLRWVADACVQERDEHNVRVGVIGILQDITERKLAEEKLRQRADQMAALNDIGLAITSTFNLDQIFRAVFERCKNLLLLDIFYIALYAEATHTVTHPLYFGDGEYKYLPPRDIRENPGLSGYVITARQTLYVPDMATQASIEKYKVIPTAGTPAHAYVGVPMFSHGKVIGLISMQNVQADAYSQEDIHFFETIAAQAAVAIENARLYTAAQQELIERKKAEAELINSETRYRQLFEQSGEAIAIMSLERKMLLANKCLEELVGHEFIKGAEAVGDVAIADEQDARQKFARVVAGENVPVYERVFYKSDGSTSITEVHLSLIRDAQGAPWYVQSIIRDITKRKRAEGALLQRDAILQAAAFAAQAFLQGLYWEENINAVLAKFGEVTQASHVYLFENHILPDGTEVTSQRHEWAAPSARPEIDNPEFQNVVLHDEVMDRWYHLLSSGQAYIGFDENMPPDEAEYLRGRGALSVIDVPIFVGDTWWGIIGFDDAEKQHHWSPAEVEALKVAANVISAAIQNARLFRESQQRAERLATIVEIGHAVSTLRDLDSVLEIIYQQVRRIAPVDTFYICLLGEDKKQLTFPLTYDKGVRYDEPDDQLIPESNLGKTIQSGKPYRLHRTPAEVIEAIQYQHGVGDAQHKSGSLLFIPLWQADEVIGVLSIQSYSLNAYPDELVETLVGIGDQVAIAIQNARLFTSVQQELAERKRAEKEIQQRLHELGSIHAISQAATSELNLDTLFELVSHELFSLFDIQELHFALHNPQKNIIEFPFEWQGRQRIESGSIPFGQGLSSRIIISRQPLLINADYEQRSAELGVVRDLPEGHDYSKNSWLGVPIPAGEQVIGMVSVMNWERENAFTETDVRLLITIAANVGIAIQNAQLVASLEKTIAELKESQERFNFFLEHTSEGFYRIDYDPPIPVDLPFEEQYKLSRQRGRFGECNLAIAKMYGYSSREEMLAAPYYAENEGSEASMRANIEFYQRGYKSDDQETEEFTSTGERAYFLNSAFGIIRDGYFVSIWGTQRNITALKKALAELEASHHELESLSYNIAHDMRSPVRALVGLSQMLKHSQGDKMDEAGRSELERIHLASKRLGQLIDGFLAFLRLSRSPLTKQMLSVVSLLTGLKDRFTRENPDRDIQFVMDELPACEADLTLLEQAWTHLIANAVKFTRPREQARIEFGSGEKDGERFYFIRDNGIGFDMKYADKIFVIFQHLNRQEEYEGVGVGLAIVQRIIHRHGGRIWAEAAPDQGAIFYFTLG